MSARSGISRRWTIALSVVAAMTAAGQAPAHGDTSGEALTLNQGRLFTTEGREVHFSRLTLTGLGADYVGGGLQEHQLIAPEKIIRIEKQSGNQALTWGLALGASAFVGSLLGVNQGESEAGGTLSSGAKTGIIAGITGVWTLIGIAYGSSQKNYAVVYKNPAYTRP